MVRLLRVLVFFVCGTISWPAAADFWDGLEAYDAGDFVTARAHWHPLAESGDAEAQAALAGLYAQGLGVAADPSRAADWFRRAAEQGHTIAQLNLGDHYARGLGVKRDPVQAWVWLSLAARQGNRWAAERRDRIEKFLDRTALLAAKRRLVDWRPK